LFVLAAIAGADRTCPPIRSTRLELGVLKKYIGRSSFLKNMSNEIDLISWFLFVTLLKEDKNNYNYM
jgi:hypothetical protein